MPTDGSAPPKVLVEESWSPSAPRWTPDGATDGAFVSAHAPSDTDSIAPSGTQAVCLSRTAPSDKWPARKERSDVRHYAHISYKFNDTGSYDDRRSHLW